MGKKSITKGKNNAESVRNYFAAVTGIDHYFGKILQTLKERGLDDNTVVVFTSDHGEMMGSQNRMTKGREYTESTGIPFIVRYPEKVKPMVDDLLISVPDIYPTLMGLMDMEDCVPSDVVGSDYSAVFNGQSFQRPESALYQIAFGGRGEFNPAPYWSTSARGVITHRYTYVVDRKKDKPTRYLYDNKKDPYQMNRIHPGDGYDKVMDKLDVELARLLNLADDPFQPWGTNIAEES